MENTDESWVDDLADDAWDRQMARDVESGRLDHVIAKVKADIAAAWEQWLETTNRLDVMPSQVTSEYQM